MYSVSVVLSWASRSTVPVSEVNYILNLVLEVWLSLALLIKPPLYLSDVALIMTIVLFSIGFLIEPEPTIPGLNFGLATKDDEDIDILACGAGVNLDAWERP